MVLPAAAMVTLHRQIAEAMLIEMGHIVIHYEDGVQPVPTTRFWTWDIGQQMCPVREASAEEVAAALIVADRVSKLAGLILTNKNPKAYGTYWVMNTD